MTFRTCWRSSAKRRQSGQTALAMFVDELQYVEEEQLAALITALHRTAQQTAPRDTGWRRICPSFQV